MTQIHIKPISVRSAYLNELRRWHRIQYAEQPCLSSRSLCDRADSACHACLASHFRRHSDQVVEVFENTFAKCHVPADGNP